MKPLLQFTIAANDSTQWRARVFIWRTLRQLQNQSKLFDCLAFCDPADAKKAHTDKDCVFVSMHFAAGEHLTTSIVAHECMHAALRFADISKLKLDDFQAEEFSVITMEAMYNAIITELHNQSVKVFVP